MAESSTYGSRGRQERERGGNRGGRLQDHDRAVIVGEPTYGKGSAQTIIPLGDAGGLKITTSRWYTPSGRSISRRSTRDDSDSSTPDADRKKEYKTDAGRVVYDGGGITPDVIESDSAYMTTARILQSVLGRKVGIFRDALTDYALSLKVSKAVPSEQFVVTPQMLDEVWKRMVARGIVMDKGVYDESSSVVKLLLSYDIARYVFGPDAEFRRRVENDYAIKTALQLATGATTQHALLDRALGRKEQQKKALGLE
jgi:Periplasmic protease